MSLVEVTHSGTIDRDDRCPKCGEGMLYRVDSSDEPVTMFCGNLMECSDALHEIEVTRG